MTSRCRSVILAMCPLLIATGSPARPTLQRTKDETPRSELSTAAALDAVCWALIVMMWSGGALAFTLDKADLWDLRTNTEYLSQRLQLCVARATGGREAIADVDEVFKSSNGVSIRPTGWYRPGRVTAGSVGALPVRSGTQGLPRSAASSTRPRTQSGVCPSDEERLLCA